MVRHGSVHAVSEDFEEEQKGVEDSFEAAESLRINNKLTIYYIITRPVLIVGVTKKIIWRG